MHKDPRFGDNRTGLAANPDLGSEMLDGMERFPPTSHHDAAEVADVMAHYVTADSQLGSVPEPSMDPPDDVDEESWLLFIDKLGERLAFERMGVRIYEGVIAKLEAHGDLPQGPERDALERLRHEELEHFRALEECIRELAGDPTAVTPSADVAGLIGSGVGMVIGDPRAGLLAALEVVLVAELADNECWETLVELARGVGHDEMAERFEVFLEQEREHLTLVRTWIASAQGRTPLGDED